MTLSRRVLICASLVGAGMVFGCGHHHHEEPVVVAQPAEYVYEPGYYDRGEYRDNAWYWHDRRGEEHHEVRDEHERRMRDWPAHREEHHDEGERH